MLVDLTVTITTDMTPVTGHPPVEFRAIDTHEQNNKSNTWMAFSIHSCGTHLDAPYHFYADGLTIDQIPVERFIGPGVRFDLRHRGIPGAAVTVEDLEKAAEIAGESLRDRIVILHTGWGSHYCRPDYYGNNPYLATEGARWLVEQGIRIVGLDMPSGKGAGGPMEKGTSRETHGTFLGAGVLMLENLTNLESLPLKGFEVMVFPLKILRGDGAPARVLARVS